jgi:predicted nucleic acid-binding protein
MQIVADTSALVSLGTVANHTWNPLGHLLDTHAIIVPTLIFDELEETAAYDDASGHGAKQVLRRREAFDERTVDLDDSFPLDEGENAAVTLTNELNATQFLCDEFNRLALIHASLVDTRLVTTPMLLVALVRNEVVSPTDAESQLDEMGIARSWSKNTYVQRARAVLNSQ